MERLSQENGVESVEAFDMAAAEELAVNEAVDRAKEKPRVFGRVQRLGRLLGLATALVVGSNEASATEGGVPHKRAEKDTKVMVEKDRLEAARAAWKDTKTEESSSESARKAWADVELNEIRTGTPFDVTSKQAAASEQKIKDSIREGRDKIGRTPDAK